MLLFEIRSAWARRRRRDAAAQRDRHAGIWGAIAVVWDER
jgi:hypothetical protein